MKADDINISLRFINNNGLRMRIADHGEGPVVLMLHGWPESWYSWRHQIIALAEAGYRVIAPDMPGYGKTDSLDSVKDYNIVNIASYVVGILDEIGVDQAILIGHDWGAAIAWSTVQLHPDRFTKLINLSVPFRPSPDRPPMEIYKERFGDRFFYQLYFQHVGEAEAEFDKDPKGILYRLYSSPDTFRFAPQVTEKNASAGGWIPRLGEPKELPDWFSQEDLDFYVNEFTESGFVGGINYYRNIDGNWNLMKPYANNPIKIPVLFMAGDKDNVIGRATREKLLDAMKPFVPNIDDVILLPNIGHWIQQETPKAVNDRVIAFLQK
ncbi:MAG: alpha/beta fold hydrolase [Cellvibrionaceae bacterium]